MALGGAQRDTQSSGRFFLAQPREETALDGAREPLVALAKKLQSAIEIEKPLGLGLGLSLLSASDALFIERHRHFAASALRREARAPG